MRSQMTIGKRLFGSFGASLVLTLIVGGTSIWIISALGNRIHELVDVNAETQHVAVRMRASVSELKSTERAILVRVMMRDTAAAIQYDRDLQSIYAAWKKDLEEFKALADSDEERKAVDEIESDYNAVGRAHEEFFQLASAGSVHASEKRHDRVRSTVRAGREGTA